MFRVKVLDYTFATFEDYETAFKVARKVRQAYRLQNRAEKVPFDVFKRQNAPGFMLVT